MSWPEERKTEPDMLASGLPGLEPLVILLLKGLEECGLPLSWAARLLAHNPARLFRIGHRKGALEPGRDADVALLRRESWTYRAAASGNIWRIGRAISGRGSSGFTTACTSWET
jgi:allantoinase